MNLSQRVAALDFVRSRSHATRMIKMGLVKLNGQVERDPQRIISHRDKVIASQHGDFASRAELKLSGASVALGLDFKGKTVIDVGSSTGGFTNYALKNGASTVLSVDIGTDQMRPEVSADKRVQLLENTDILDVQPPRSKRLDKISVRSEKGINFGDTASQPMAKSTDGEMHLSKYPDLIMIDVSFTSLRQVLPHIARLSSQATEIVAMMKPQFEATPGQKNKGVVKNSTVRRQIVREFEGWLRPRFVVKSKSDSHIPGANGNVERFYLLGVSGRR